MSDNGDSASQTALMDATEMLGTFAEQLHVPSVRPMLRGLQQKLASGRFNLAVLGQMKRGKSSVINALLGAEVLPTGILPLTSVITKVRYGTSPLARIHYNSGNIEEIAPGDLHEYIAEASNPGNRKQVATAELNWPSPLLELGIDLIDTPGIGSTHAHNTKTTEDYLSQVDAGLVVLSVDPPITASESDFLRSIRQEIPRLLFVVNKIDLASDRECDAVLRFLALEITNRVGIGNPEIFPASARRALEAHNGNGACCPEPGLARLTSRLRQFAVEETQQVLLESVAHDVRRIAGTLRFAASVGERAGQLSGDELELRRQALNRVLAKAVQELQDLRHLLHQDVSVVLGRIERDLKQHVESATPLVREDLSVLWAQHPQETGQSLGILLNQFLEKQVARVFEDWRIREDQRAQQDLQSLAQRCLERANGTIGNLQAAAGSLFDVAVPSIEIESSLAVESHLYYYTEPVFKFLLEKLIFVLPGPLMRQITFRRMLNLIDLEFSRNSGRIRYDYLERLGKSVARFEKEIVSAVSMVADNLRVVVNGRSETATPDRSTTEGLDLIIAQCTAIVSTSSQAVAGHRQEAKM